MYEFSRTRIRCRLYWRRRRRRRSVTDVRSRNNVAVVYNVIYTLYGRPPRGALEKSVVKNRAARCLKRTRCRRAHCCVNEREICVVKRARGRVPIVSIRVCVAFFFSFSFYRPTVRNADNNQRDDFGKTNVLRRYKSGVGWGGGSSIGFRSRSWFSECVRKNTLPIDWTRRWTTVCRL